MVRLSPPVRAESPDLAEGAQESCGDGIAERTESRRTTRIDIPDPKAPGGARELPYGRLREQGTPIPTNDLWIAALVVEDDLPQYSRDEHFRHLPQCDVR